MIQRSKCILRLTAVAILCCLPLIAGCPPTPRRTAVKRDRPSANREFVVPSDPQAKKISVFAARDMEMPIWSFDHDIQLDHCMVSNDGDHVAVIWWPVQPAKDEGKRIALRFVHRVKGEFKAYQLDEVCFRFGGVGMRRDQFADPAPWAEMPMTATADTISFKTIDCHDCEYSLTTGEVLRRERFLSGFEQALIWLGIGIAIVIAVVFAIIMVLVGMILIACMAGTRQAPAPPRHRY